MANRDIRKAVTDIIMRISERHKDSFTNLKNVTKELQDLRADLIDLRKALENKSEMLKQLQEKVELREDKQDKVKDKLFEVKDRIRLAARKLEQQAWQMKDYLDKTRYKDEPLYQEWIDEYRLKKTAWLKEVQEVQDERVKIESDIRIAKKVEDKDEATALSRLLEFEKGILKRTDPLHKRIDKVWKEATEFTETKDPEVSKAPHKPYIATLPPDLQGGPLVKERVLGGGTYGEVVSVKQPLTGSTAAVKFFHHPHDKDGSKSRKERKKELKLYEEIGDHPHIVKCYGEVVMGKEKGLAMEKLDGGSLSDKIDELRRARRKGYISESDFYAATSHMMKGLLSGLAHLESLGYVHSDLKPGNVGMDKDFNVKLIDIGAALKKGEQLQTWTDKYVDPFAHSKEGVDPANDVFASGHILHKLMHGEAFTYGGIENMYVGIDHFRTHWISKDSSRVMTTLSKSQTKELNKAISKLNKALGSELKKLRTKVEKKGYDLEKAKREARALISERDSKVMELQEQYVDKYSSSYESAYVKFLNALMHPDPKKRLTAKEALSHPFIQDSLMLNDKQVNDIFHKVDPELGTPVKKVESSDVKTDVEVDETLEEWIDYEMKGTGHELDKEELKEDQQRLKKEKELREQGKKLSEHELGIATYEAIKKAQASMPTWKNLKSWAHDKWVKGGSRFDLVGVGLKEFKKGNTKSRKVKTLEGLQEYYRKLEFIENKVGHWWAGKDKDEKKIDKDKTSKTGRTRQDKYSDPQVIRSKKSKTKAEKQDLNRVDALNRLRPLINKAKSDLNEVLLMWEAHG